VWESPSIPDPPPIQAGVGTPGVKKGGCNVSGTEGWFFSTGRELVGGESRTHQAGPGSPGPGSRGHDRQGTQARPKRDMY